MKEVGWCRETELFLTDTVNYLGGESHISSILALNVSVQTEVAEGSSIGARTRLTVKVISGTTGVKWAEKNTKCVYPVQGESVSENLLQWIVIMFDYGTLENQHWETTCEVCK